MNHHELIRSLISELRQCRDQLEQANNAYYWHEEQAVQRARRAEREADDARREAETERYNREMLAEKYAYADRLDQIGDRYGAQQAREQARRWYS